MGFEKFGKISFTPFTKVSDFANYLKAGKIKTTKCKSCRTQYFPPRADCVRCGSGEFEWVELSGRGTLVTYTTVHVAPTGFESEAPYVIGVIELEEGGRLLAWLEGLKPEEIKIGMKLQVVPKPLPEDRISYTLKRV